MALAKNRKGVMAILKKLQPRIVGRPHPGFSCNCGAIHEGPGVAISIEPGGDRYPGQEVLWSLWSVRISHHPEEASIPGGFSVGLSEFIPIIELDKIFTQHFGKNPDSNNPYQPEINDEIRAELGYPSVVAIMDDTAQVRFCFDWGKEQETAAKIDSFASSRKTKHIEKDSDLFNVLVDILRSITPEVYLGGPEPVLSFEPSWHMEYQTALNKAVSEANHLFLQNASSVHSSAGHFLLGTDVVFMKKQYAN